MKKTVSAIMTVMFAASVICGAEHEFKGKKLIHAGWSDGSTDTVRKYIGVMEKSAPVYSGMRIFVTGKDENNKIVTHRMMFGPRKFKYEYFRIFCYCSCYCKSLFLSSRYICSASSYY